MAKSYSWLTNQPPATRSVDFVITRMILPLIALLFAQSFYYHYYYTIDAVFFAFILHNYLTMLKPEEGFAIFSREERRGLMIWTEYELPIHFLNKNVTGQYRVSKINWCPFIFKFAITYCNNCIKTNGFLLMGQNNLTRCGISIYRLWLIWIWKASVFFYSPCIHIQSV